MSPVWTEKGPVPTNPSLQRFRTTSPVALPLRFDPFFDSLGGDFGLADPGLRLPDLPGFCLGFRPGYLEAELESSFFYKGMGGSDPEAQALQLRGAGVAPEDIYRDVGVSGSIGANSRAGWHILDGRLTSGDTL